MKIEINILYGIVVLLKLANCAIVSNNTEDPNLTDWHQLNLSPNVSYELMYLRNKNFTDLRQPIFDGFQISLLLLMANSIRLTSNQSFAKIIGLTQLKLGNNQISSFYELITNQFGLTSVSLYSNLIAELNSPFDEFTECRYPNLNDIDLHANIITFISDYSFSAFCNLQNLFLFSNRIAFVTAKTFANLTKLNTLMMQNNFLKSVDDFVVYSLNNLGIIL